MGSCRLELYSPCLLNLCLGVRSASKITTENPYASYVSALVNRIQCSDTSGCECKRDSAQPVIDGGRMEVPGLVSALGPNNIEQLARGIMTTDTVPKIASAEIAGIRIAGVAKGAGMIHPDMATMLSFVMTDAELPYAELDEALRYAVPRSFNSISVDGDTSTNDMVVVLANGASGVRPSADEFRDKLTEVCIELATAIVRDGEGATKFVEITVEGAPSEEAAHTI